ncbi:MAG: 16S rRNA (cytosine(1402)-N(4))-methyltransferase RsmH [Burkholderiales bacterium]|nr:16S rRNA (cytosine(1402)-N(4))-methyltransferase RsmH [Phycisphaerae bacterium]
MDIPTTGHDPVLLPEILEHLALKPGAVAVDCTTGRGGHTQALASAVGASGTILALDYDPRNLEFAKQRLEGLPVRFFHANFSELDAALAAAGISEVDGILADLGISTNQLFEREYGLSFSVDQPLNMRLDPRGRTSAKTIINSWPEEKIANLLFQLADERFSRRIARKIVEARKQSPINTTEHLAELVRSVVPHVRSKGRSVEIDPATRTFLALRMAVNGEMENLERLLKIAPKFLKSGGRIAIISFHSTEDRLVKQAFRSAEQTGVLKVITSKPLVPSDAEISANPRSRSAKLRVAQKP